MTSEALLLGDDGHSDKLAALLHSFCLETEIDTDLLVGLAEPSHGRIVDCEESCGQGATRRHCCADVKKTRERHSDPVRKMMCLATIAPPPRRFYGGFWKSLARDLLVRANTSDMEQICH